MADKTFTHAPLIGKAALGPDGVPVYTFRMTSETIDRQGEIVTLDGWNFERYLTNPVVLDTHDYDSIESIVGRTVSIDRDADGWNATIRFNGSEYGLLAQRLVEDGDLRAVSVGFRPLVIEYPDANALRRARTLDDATEKALVSVAPDPATAVRHVEKELLEISVVPIPANPDAIRIRSVNGASTAVSVAPVNKAVAPGWMRDNARQGIAWYEDGKAGDGVTAQTVREAREIASGNVTADKATRMAAWFARHMGDLDAPAADPSHPDYPSPGVVAHALWGGGSRSESERAASWARAHAKEANVAETKGAIPYKKTPLAPEAQRWDGPREVARATVDDLKVMCAWVDASAPDIEASYKLAHHTADADHPAVWRGVAQCMSIVFGGRGGVDVPDSDRRAIYNHLASHYEDFGKTPPEWGPGAATRSINEFMETEEVMTTDAWPAVACAMHAVLLDTGIDDAARRRVYVGLERAYQALGKVAPTLIGRDVIAKLGDAERDGMFWHGEPTLAKAGRVLSGANEMRLRQALDLLTQVLASMGGGDTPPAPEVPGPQPYGTEALSAEVAGLKALMESWK